jgi:hypothetical protein
MPLCTSDWVATRNKQEIRRSFDEDGMVLFKGPTAIREGVWRPRAITIDDCYAREAFIFGGGKHGKVGVRRTSQAETICNGLTVQ